MMPLVHMYRAEVGRMTAYRRRLDATTHLAVVTAGALITFVLGRVETSPHLLGLGLLVQVGLLSLEGRRYQRMSIFRDRVLLLERGLYVDLLAGSEREAWKTNLRSSLEDPRPSIGQLTAMGVRLRMGHLFVVYAYVAAWLLALTRGPETWLLRATAGPVPGEAVVAAVGLLVLAATGWAARTAPDLES